MLKALFKAVFTAGIIITSAVNASGKEYNEAPMLAKLVKEGKLPPVEERLPDDPWVIGPGTFIGEEWMDFQIGNYSDGKFLVTADIAPRNYQIGIAAGNFLIAPDQSTSPDKVKGALAEWVKWNDDYSKYTIKIRPGLKWSDGHPVTTEDVRFVFEDIYEYEPLGIPCGSHRRSLYTQMDPRQDCGKLDIIDKHTFSITFSKPYGYFLSELTTWIQDHMQLIQPSHFLKKLHPKYTDESKLNEMAKEHGVEGFKQLFAIYESVHWDICCGNEPRLVDLPTLYPWKLVERNEDMMRVERNPYYAGVDPEGNQLPYIDGIITYGINDKEALIMKLVSGEVDFSNSDFMKISDMPTYIQNAERGGYNVLMTGSINGPPTLYVNQDWDYENPDSQWQKMIQDENNHFTKALALAIDSEDINNSLYFNLYEMPTITSAEYNPKKANELLDKAGMNKRDDDGYRTYPDGSPFRGTILTANMSPDMIDICFMLTKYFQAVGLNINAKMVTSQVLRARTKSNEMPFKVLWHDEPIWYSGISRDYDVCMKGDWSCQTKKYMETKGKEGYKPPAHMVKYYDMNAARMAVPPESPEGQELFNNLLSWFSEGNALVWPIGKIQVPNIFKKNIKNIPREGYPYNLGISESAPIWFVDNE